MEDELKKYQQLNKWRLRFVAMPMISVLSATSGMLLAQGNPSWWFVLTLATGFAILATLMIALITKSEEGSWRAAAAQGIDIFASQCFGGLVALGLGYAFQAWFAN